MEFCLLNPNIDPKLANSKVKGSWAAFKVLRLSSDYEFCDYQTYEIRISYDSELNFKLGATKIFCDLPTHFEKIKMCGRNENFDLKFGFSAKFRVE